MGNRKNKMDTLGEKRVRTSFNPSDDSNVQHIKERGAEFINYINNTLPNPKDAEQARLKALALTSIEEGTMWAVKAATA
jgi:hypothetical protein